MENAVSSNETYQMADTFAIVPFREGLNIELFDKIKRAILSHPQNFNMSFWVSGLNEQVERFFKAVESGAKDEDYPCGTSACIAGWACVLSPKAREMARIWMDAENARMNEKYLIDGTFTLSDVMESRASDWGPEVLGLQGVQESERLFIKNWWPYRFRQSADKPEIGACNRIDHFILTGE